MNRIFAAVLISFSLLTPSTLYAAEQLLVVGGGKRPEAAIEKFVTAADKNFGRILVIAWASEVPNEAVQGFKQDLAKFFRGTVDASLAAPTHELEQFRFLNQLSLATAVFFTGGSQDRIMAAFAKPSGEELLRAIVQKYESGVIFGGTSAGTAIMSDPMIAGGDSSSNVTLAKGLGLAHAHEKRFIIDQHFSQRKREDRLIGAMKIAGIDYGLGVDEDTALLIVDREDATVFGNFTVRAFALSNEKVTEIKMQRGESFNLKTWKRSRSSTHQVLQRMSLPNIYE